MTTTSSTLRVTVRDGTHIQAFVRNAGDGRPCIALVHSLAMDHTFWRATIDRLPDDVSVLAIDARGHGASDKAPGPYTCALMAADLLDVLRHLGWDRVVVGGASMGGCVALQFAIDHPQATSALALMGTTSWYGPTAPKDWAGRAEKARQEGLKALVDFQKTRWFGDAFRESHADVVDNALDIFLRNDIDAYAATCHMLGAFNASDKLGQVHVPTAVLVGEQDQAATPAMAEVLHQGIAGSTLQVVAGARHLLPLEQPELVAATLQDLVARSAARS